MMMKPEDIVRSLLQILLSALPVIDAYVFASL